MSRSASQREGNSAFTLMLGINRTLVPPSPPPLSTISIIPSHNGSPSNATIALEICTIYFERIYKGKKLGKMLVVDLCGLKSLAISPNSLGHFIFCVSVCVCLCKLSRELTSVTLTGSSHVDDTANMNVASLKKGLNLFSLYVKF